ncbi:MAG: hypothetical protein KGI50_06190 [Patescibacteria group bacterium]|nr:hypothetical protein [Patescibacteria group bacterium]MDE2438974.1 hypothetical protein [Patescibacteria group bacterium]
MKKRLYRYAENVQIFVITVAFLLILFGKYCPLFSILADCTIIMVSTAIGLTLLLWPPREEIKITWRGEKMRSINTFRETEENAGTSKNPVPSQLVKRINVDQATPQIDVVGPEWVEVVISDNRVWVNVDNVCMFRACRITNKVIVDRSRGGQ